MNAYVDDLGAKLRCKKLSILFFFQSPIIISSKEGMLKRACEISAANERMICYRHANRYCLEHFLNE